MRVQSVKPEGAKRPRMLVRSVKPEGAKQLRLQAWSAKTSAETEGVFCWYIQINNNCAFFPFFSVSEFDISFSWYHAVNWIGELHISYLEKIRKQEYISCLQIKVSFPWNSLLAWLFTCCCQHHCLCFGCERGSGESRKSHSITSLALKMKVDQKSNLLHKIFNDCAFYI